MSAPTASRQIFAIVSDILLCPLTFASPPCKNKDFFELIFGLNRRTQQKRVPGPGSK